MKIERNGKFWRFLTFSESNKSRLREAAWGDNPLDVCEVRWMCVKAAALWTVLTLLMTFFVSLCGYMLTDFVVWIVYMLVFGLVEPSGAAFGVCIAIAVASIVGAVRLFSEGNEVIKESKVGIIYRSWRDKYCEKVEIV